MSESAHMLKATIMNGIPKAYHGKKLSLRVCWEGGGGGGGGGGFANKYRTHCVASMQTSSDNHMQQNDIYLGVARRRNLLRQEGNSAL